MSSAPSPFSLFKFQQYLTKSTSQYPLFPHIASSSNPSRILAYKSLDSTHVRLKALCANASPQLHGTLIVSQHQTRGIGRIAQRQWISQMGGLYFSFVSVFGDGSGMQSQDTNEALIQEIFMFRICVAVAMVECAREALRQALQETNTLSSSLSPENLILKWPNDLYYVNGKDMFKVGGMLMDNEFVVARQQRDTESQSQPQNFNMKMKMKMQNVQLEDEELPTWVSIEGDEESTQQKSSSSSTTTSPKVKCFTGIGINVNQKNWNKHFPEGESLSGIMNRATNADTSYEFEIERILAGFFNSLRKWLSVSDKKQILDQYKKVLGGMGQEVKVMPQRKESSDVYYFATVVDVSSSGNLIVKRRDTGETVELASEEVSLRPVLNEK